MSATLLGDIIDIDGLVAADAELGKLRAFLSDYGDESLKMAHVNVADAIREIESDEGSYEDCLQAAIDNVDDAIEEVSQFLEYLADMHARGKVVASNDAVQHVRQGCETVLNHVAQWADDARSQLRDL